MKKTILAASIAALVAAPAAFADVKISGQLNYEFVDADNNDMGEDLNTDVVISGSEDLGNGMTASFKLAGSPDGSSDGFGDDQIISLKGDFGTISVGRMETFSESQVRAMAANDTSDSGSNEVAGTVGQRENGVIAYASPSINGFQVHAAATILDSAAGQTKDYDNTDFGVSYSNGPLTIKVGQSDGFTQDSAGAVTTTQAKETSIGISYTMGDFKVAVVNAEVDIDGTTAATDDTWVGVSYTMGANTFAVSSRSSDTAGADDDTISVKHALSKSTSVGLTHISDETANSDQTILTIAHSF
jgi:predicted porin